jgi:hypothetical protein
MSRITEGINENKHWVYALLCFLSLVYSVVLLFDLYTELQREVVNHPFINIITFELITLNFFGFFMGIKSVSYYHE